MEVKFTHTIGEVILSGLDIDVEIPDGDPDAKIV